MKFRSFKHNYHDGQLASFVLGPRRELTLEIALDPVWNKEEPPAVTVRFAGIKNYDEVAAFFRTLPQPSRPDAYIAEIVGLKYVGEGPNWVIIDLDRHPHVQVHSQNV